MATYISLDNLARYDMKAKARAEGLYADASAACWQKTEKAGAVTCVPAPETPLEPVVEFLFKETLPSGDKSPSNPSTIEGVSSVKVTRGGKNLCPETPTWNVMGSRGITASYDSSDGGWNLSGASSSSAYPFLYFITDGSQGDYPTSLKKGVAYTFSVDCPDSNVYLRVIDSTYSDSWDTTSSGFTQTGQTVTHTMLENGKSFIFRLQVARNVTINTKAYIHVELGDSALGFEKYISNDNVIQLGSTYYGGTLDVASGKLTVTHRMVEPSSGAVDISDRPALLPLEYTDTYGRNVTSDGNTLSVGSSGGQIVYRLANPYTVYVDPVQIDSLPALGKTSPRVNTVYTDALNVQVGYAEHPAYTEELINNAILALGGDI